MSGRATHPRVAHLDNWNQKGHGGRGTTRARERRQARYHLVRRNAFGYHTEVVLASSSCNGARLGHPRGVKCWQGRRAKAEKSARHTWVGWR